MASLIAASCASSGEKAAEPDAQAPLLSEPAWVHGDCAAHWGGKLEGRIAAVGAATDRQPNRAAAQAQRQARAQLEAILAPRVDAAVKDFAATKAGQAWFGDPAEDELLARTVRSIGAGLVRGAEVADLTVSADGSVHVLMSLTREQLEQALGQLPLESEDLRAALMTALSEEMRRMEKDVTLAVDRPSRSPQPA